MKYDAYGAIRNTDSSTSGSNKFCGGLGHTVEDSTGLTYMRARYYDPNLGRFISQDSEGNGINWFVYCGNNPVNKIDCDGKKALDPDQWTSYEKFMLGSAGMFAISLVLVKAPLTGLGFAAFGIPFIASASLAMSGATGLKFGETYDMVTSLGGTAIAYYMVILPSLGKLDAIPGFGMGAAVASTWAMVVTTATLYALYF
ncbi:MAG: RHS repeat-associated core domain-containing protein [Armatimonadota bacterium]